MKAYSVYGLRSKGSNDIVEMNMAFSLKELPVILWTYLNHGLYVEVLNLHNNKGLGLDSTDARMVEYSLKTGDVSKFKELLGDFRSAKTSVKKTTKKTTPKKTPAKKRN